jgi:prepilin-type N-terminal cleavage/methylation domain-containing protein
MARLIRKAKQYGFTLVELLIVVAIIGVLSTVGIPSFRRMVQKSKKSEAKVNLGGLYTAEQAFFSEYGAFGTNLARMGFQIDGNPANLMYTVGFVTAACASRATAAGNVLPTKGGNIGKAIVQAFPQYYDGTGVPINSRLGNALMTNGCATPATTTATYGAAYNTAGANVFNGTATSDSDRFLAIAAGVIAPNFSKTAPGALNTDVWGINDARLMSNLQDGVR